MHKSRPYFGKFHKIYTSIISDKNLYPKEIPESTNKYKLLVHLKKCTYGFWKCLPELDS